ncbi:MAG: 1-acyl-sn-glycerol-3-phosphate acyltransferase [Actinomycetota bacterium]
MIPPRIVRRLVVAPVVLIVCAALIAASPVGLTAALIYDLLTRSNLRATRAVLFFAYYLVLEIVGIVYLALLWLAGGTGFKLKSQLMQRAHYAYMRWWLRRLRGAAARLFRLRIEIHDPPQPRWGPVLVFSRHAGPGNSLMLVGTLMLEYRRLPRIVMLSKLQWDPLIDIVGNRLPNRFIHHGPAHSEQSRQVVAELAADTTDDSAFILFPEGRDFTDKLRLRAIAHLRTRGHLDRADKAERMMRVLPPRHGGVAAAVGAAPEADVVFVAHTVLEDVGSFGELFNRIPFTRPVAARYWRIPNSEVPDDPDELIDWLYGWWERIDSWILSQIQRQSND